MLERVKRPQVWRVLREQNNLNDRIALLSIKREQTSGHLKRGSGIQRSSFSLVLQFRVDPKTLLLEYVVLLSEIKHRTGGNTDNGR